MPPLILHNVPDEELYVGEDGIQRPYAMLFPGNESNPLISRSRKNTFTESGSFGKSTRRSRSRTGTPAARREDPTLEAANAIFSNFMTSRVATAPEIQRPTSLSASVSQPNLLGLTALATNDTNSTAPLRYVHKEPTEVILRGFRASHQYAALREYERIGGRICEDYPRDPPLEQRRYKSDLRDPASLRTQPMTAEEKAKAMRFAGGEHWIKITFESAEGAEAAVDASPQTIQGHLVFAELYRGVPPTADEPVPLGGRGNTFGASSGKGIFGATRQSSSLSRSYTTPAMSQIGRGMGIHTISPSGSNTSSQTLESATISHAGTSTSSGTVMPDPPVQQASTQNATPEVYCRGIRTAKRIQLLPAEQALLPQKSYGRRVMAQIPFLSWFTGDMIGSTVPRTENGEFDYARASMYWLLIYWLDRLCFGIFEVSTKEKEE
ncbi:hypothetical protein HYALB_00009568 [Hymenoscyphus albidus]|uniref:Nup53p-like protein n=1 Tax=Hymenoscyphus albidus TaxID=595503 RepID=A0A9N9LK56_9HELO|nr:hypothetical protein HYALB_00009568 [Hymenoscyphus albidus]